MKLTKKILIIMISTMLMLSACENIIVESAINPVVTIANSVATIPISEESKKPILLSTQIPTIKPVTSKPVNNMIDWKDLPVVPGEISLKTQEIYELGQELHNNPYAFSVVGDCESSPSWFLGDFDRGIPYYSLGKFSNLKLVIDAFQGSFERKSPAVGNGYNTARVLSPSWENPESCIGGETPLDCELRIHHPSYVFILLGTNDIYNLDNFEKYLRKILDILVEKGIVPILATKADNLEGGNKINAIISGLAYEYEIPLWNFWRAAQPLPNNGLLSDGAHLTWAKNDFGDAKAMDNAWPWRNLTALQVLDFAWRTLQDIEY